MAINEDGTLLSRHELEMKVFEQEKQIRDLDVTVESLSLLSAKLLNDIAQLKRLMEDDGK